MLNTLIESPASLKIGMALKAALDEAHRDNSVNDAVWLANFVRDRFLI